MKGDRENSLGGPDQLGMIQPQHLGDIGPVNVGIQDSHFVPLAGEADRQVDRHGALSDAPFSAHDHDPVVDMGQLFPHHPIPVGPLFVF